MEDRTVHARSGHLIPAELVRYDRAGKWYLEWRGHDRRRMTIEEAAKLAHVWRQLGGEVFFGRRGGTRFDALVKARPLREHASPSA